ncbi:hypothetical protein MAR_015290 [Mya arenaria]|uniref:Uncharacterized protein n=1 Tax=Mya arenaria TaxID=6604 RepID=A0ABY7FK61_MYAAR|nr:hypothetical protein MAR_015290 [Mya arenaria]
MAYQWMSYLAHENQINIQHGRNYGEKQIGPYKVDGYYERDGEKVVLEFHGCFWHGCQKCFSTTTINPVNDTSMGDLYERTMAKKDFIESEGYSYESKWECDFKNDMEINLDMKQYIHNLEYVGPLEPSGAAQKEFYVIVYLFLCIDLLLSHTFGSKFFRDSGKNNLILVFCSGLYPPLSFFIINSFNIQLVVADIQPGQELWDRLYSKVFYSGEDKPYKHKYLKILLSTSKEYFCVSMKGNVRDRPCSFKPCKTILREDRYIATMSKLNLFMSSKGLAEVTSGMLLPMDRRVNEQELMKDSILKASFSMIVTAAIVLGSKLCATFSPSAEPSAFLGSDFCETIPPSPEASVVLGSDFCETILPSPEPSVVLGSDFCETIPPSPEPSVVLGSDFCETIPPSPEPSVVLGSDFCETIPPSPEMVVLGSDFSETIPPSPEPSVVFGSDFCETTPPSPEPSVVLGSDFCETTPPSPEPSVVLGSDFCETTPPSPEPSVVLGPDFCETTPPSPEPSVVLGSDFCETTPPSPEPSVVLGSDFCETIPPSPEPSVVLGSDFCETIPPSPEPSVVLGSDFCETIPPSPEPSVVLGSDFCETIPPSPEPSDLNYEQHSLHQLNLLSSLDLNYEQHFLHQLNLLSSLDLNYEQHFLHQLNLLSSLDLNYEQHSLHQLNLLLSWDLNLVQHSLHHFEAELGFQSAALAKLQELGIPVKALFCRTNNYDKPKPMASSGTGCLKWNIDGPLALHLFCGTLHESRPDVIVEWFETAKETETKLKKSFEGLIDVQLPIPKTKSVTQRVIMAARLRDLFDKVSKDCSTIGFEIGQHKTLAAGELVDMLLTSWTCLATDVQYRRGKLDTLVICAPNPEIFSIAQRLCEAHFSGSKRENSTGSVTKPVDKSRPLTADVYVCTISPECCITGKSAGALNIKSKYQLEKDLRDKYRGRKLKISEVAVVKGSGDLRCKHVIAGAFDFVAYSYQDYGYKSKNDFYQVAFPAIAVGFGYPVKIIAEQMFKSVQIFPSNGTINTVTFVIYKFDYDILEGKLLQPAKTLHQLNV